MVQKPTVAEAHVVVLVRPQLLVVGTAVVVVVSVAIEVVVVVAR
jgi:hypothetical protein